MNKQEYADKWSLFLWQELCKSQDFVEAFWCDNFEKCDEIASSYLGMK